MKRTMDGSARAVAIATQTIPRDKVAAIMAVAAAVAEGLTPKTRRALAALEKLSPAQRAGRTVEVDAQAVLALVQVHGEIVELLNSELSRLSGELQASKQTSLAL